MVSLLGVLSTALSAGEFSPPAEGPVAFRRDRMPLDVETMADVAEKLATLADGLDPQTARERRGAAQMLALSLALDPGNSAARGLIEDFTAGKHKRDADDGKMEKSRASLWQVIGWLDTPEAGPQGQSLAACLKDVLVISDPKDPRGESLREAGERGKWAGWIPPLAKYETVVAAAGDTPVEPVPAEVRLEKATVKTMLFSAVNTGRMPQTVPFVASVSMTSERTDNDAPFFVHVGSQAGAMPTGDLIKLLEKQHGKLPAGIRVTIGVEGSQILPPAKNTPAINAAAAVLASAAVTGNEPDATIIGTLDEAGNFLVPPDLWSQLRSLGKGSGGRLILPAGAADTLPSLLAMEQPQFFFDYEVLLAVNFKDVLELSVKNPEGPLASATNKFRELREKSTTLPVGQYVGNPFVRRRLLETAQEVPNHYSARMLALQGSGNRPVFLPRKLLIHELRRAIEPMEWITKRTSPGYTDEEIPRIAPTYETCRSAVDGLFRYTEKSDRDLLTLVQELVAKLRPLDRATTKARDYYDTVSPMQAAQTAIMTTYAQVSLQLALDGTR
ncbi:hypothetical protein JIN84_07510 [Luteolibacter yonseiensis]|uniref:Uncharacterized protein n=1 Tax=Luteolibacter yonseiensis TaxID=1144680 RepID=A0A934R560_9BACT|nr:hypothetical protein [Luteolibacter yonseiensis]MBK1815455.1 hypothetical protein [Luteolibacter yonseiensis]